MTSHPSDRPVSVLRARMIEDMNVRGFSEKTRSDYIRNVRCICRLYRPVSRHRDGGGPAPFPAPSGADRRAAAKHQQCRCGAAFLFHRIHAGMQATDPSGCGITTSSAPR
jgi:hypothetical protein